jgi:D-alanyl-D-alanine carboxypeptidase
VDLQAAISAALDREMSDHPEVRSAAVQVHLLSRGIVARASAGEADTTAHTAMTEDTPIRTASITKLMTAVMVMQLIEEGRLALDSTLERLDGVIPLDRLHVIGNVSSGRTITVEELLRHQSGLADYFFDGPVGEDGLTPYLHELVTGPPVVRTASELVLWTIANLPPVAPPGTEYHYADTNYVLLGLLIESVEQMPLPEIYRTRLFSPLGMSSAHLECYEPAPAGGVPAHTFYGDLDVTGLCLGEWGGGGIVATLGDVDRFLAALSRGDVFQSRATLDTMIPADEIQPGLGYGLGITLRRHAGMEFWGHDGSFGCFAYYLPGTDAIVVATVNQVNTDVAYLLRDLVLAAQGAGQ